MKLPRARMAKRGRIEIIPMIDVMFFLLVTFMITSLYMHKLDAVGIQLPRGQAEQVKDTHQITIAVHKDGQVTLNKVLVPAHGLTSALQAVLRSNDTIVIAADTDARHGDVVDAMLEARAAGVRDFAIAVDHE